jgi:multiple sugar transport system permease protein
MLSTSSSAVAPSIAKTHSAKYRIDREALVGWAFVAPALLGFLVFYLLPTCRALFISMTDWNLLRVPKIVGLANYDKLIHDKNFWSSMWTTALYVLYNIPAQTVLGLLLAVLLQRLTKSVAVRSLFLVPYLVSNVIVAMLWYWMLDPVLGFGNAVLGLFGIHRIAFFNDPNLALLTIAAVNIWRHTGFTALLFYTGLQSIPPEVYEAARIEGAKAWRIFWNITLPLLRPTIAFVSVTSIIGSFQIFDTVAVTTRGGPANSTQTIVWYIYQNAFSSSRMGYASAMSCVLFVFLIFVSLVQMRVLRAGESDLK